MSAKWTFRTFACRVGNPIRKLILLRLADQANDDGECWPSYGTLSQAVECSRRSVINHIKDLEKMGFIEIKSRNREDGSSTSNVYKLSYDENGMSEVQDFHQGSANDAPSPSANATPQESIILETIKETGGGDQPLSISEDIDSTTKLESSMKRTLTSDVIRFIEKKANRKFSIDNGWTQKIRSEVNKLSHQLNHDAQRIVRVLTWWADGDCPITIEKAWDLCDKFSKIESQMNFKGFAPQDTGPNDTDYRIMETGVDRQPSKPINLERYKREVNIMPDFDFDKVDKARKEGRFEGMTDEEFNAEIAKPEYAKDQK